jgi:hypothetical protein
VSCPARVLRQDRVPAIIARARANPSICLIFCDEKEEAAPAVAHRMTTQGYTNVKVLSGGLTAVARRSPLLLDGEVPGRMLEEPSPGKGGAMAASSRAGGGRTARGASRHGSVGSRSRAAHGSGGAARETPTREAIAAAADSPVRAPRSPHMARSAYETTMGSAGSSPSAAASKFDREALVRRGIADRSGAGAASLLGMSVHDRPTPRH